MNFMRRLSENMVSYLVAVVLLSGISISPARSQSLQKSWQSIQHQGEDRENKFDYAEAKKYYQQGLEVAAKLGQDSNERLESLAHICNVCVLQNQLSEAETYFLALVALVQDKKKKNSKLSNHGLSDGLMSAMDDLADSYFDCKIASKRAESLKHALRLRDLISGDLHPEMSNNLWELVRYYNNLQKFFEAEPYGDRLVAIDLKKLKFDDPRLATELKTLGTIKGNNRKFKEAESYLRQAISIYFSKKMMLAAAITKTDLAQILMKKNDLEKAEKTAGEALSSLETLYGVNSDSTVGARNILAQIQMKRKLWSQAQKNLNISLKALEIRFGVNNDVQISTLKQLQECYELQGNKRLARVTGEKLNTIQEIMAKVKSRN